MSPCNSDVNEGQLQMPSTLIYGCYGLFNKKRLKIPFQALEDNCFNVIFIALEKRDS